MALKCTRVINNYERVNGKLVICNRQLTEIGFWEDTRGVFRLACKEHWLVRKEF